MMPKKLTVSLIAAAAIAATIGGAFLALRPSTEERFIRACEDVLKERLRAPATYARSSISSYGLVTPTLDQFMGWKDAAEREKEMLLVQRHKDLRMIYLSKQDAFNTGNPQLLRAVLEYDAANAYNTPLRAAVECSVPVYKSESIDDLEFLGVRVDGDSALEWAVAAVHKSS